MADQPIDQDDVDILRPHLVSCLDDVRAALDHVQKLHPEFQLQVAVRVVDYSPDKWMFATARFGSPDGRRTAEKQRAYEPAWTTFGRLNLPEFCIECAPSQPGERRDERYVASLHATAEKIAGIAVP